MKNVICWTAVVIFLALAMSALKTHDFGIAAVMGAIAFGAMVAAPSGAKKTSKANSSR